MTLQELLKLPKKEQVLNMHKLIEEEQIDWLIDNDVLRFELPRFCMRTETPSKYYRPQNCGIESLADCAFRLRDETVEKSWVDWQCYCAIVLGHNRDCFKNTYSPGYFGNRAQPVHWIQAALLAKGENPNEST